MTRRVSEMSFLCKLDEAGEIHLPRGNVWCLSTQMRAEHGVKTKPTTAGILC